MSIYLNFFMTFILVVWWEFFELYILEVHEHIPNKLFDVLAGIIGFFMMFFIVEVYGLMEVLDFEIILTTAYFILIIWGFLSYKRKKKLE